MIIDLTGQRAVIAGASKGLGYAVAMKLAAAGCAVSICARQADRLREAHAGLAATGVLVHSAVCDLADAASIDAYIAAAGEELGGIDILVNNATGQASGNSEDDWASTLAVDLMGTVRATGAARAMLEASASGCVVNISSRTAMGPSPATQAYGAVKAALVQLTTSQAAEMARSGVRVNCVAPGSFEYPGGWWDRCRTSNPDLHARTLASFPFGRFGHQDDVADAILFLVSPLARWITGQTILVDGGQTLGV